MNRNGMAFWMVVATLALPLSLSAQKESIYSWTDENGVQHFSDKLPSEPEAQVEQIPVTRDPGPAPGAALPQEETAATEGAAEPAREDTPADPAEELSYADQQRQAMAEKRQAQREKQAERQRICLRATDQLNRIEPSRRVFYTDESGNTSRLDDEERVRMVEENRKLVEEYCD